MKEVNHYEDHSFRSDIHELRINKSLYKLHWENHKAVSALSFRS